MQSKEDLDKMQSKEDLDKMQSEKDLIEKLKSLLQNKRYIIVLDDIWNIDAWESIKHALPENNNGSRVIVTTRIEEVANNCCAGAGGIDYVYKLELLSKENSMELFENRVFGHGKHCPKHLQKVKNDVVMKCGGLPLAIVAMAGIFASMPNLNDQQQWTNLLNNLPSALETKHSLESMKQVLPLSYNHLPYFIKPCFLYLSIFPEFHLIKRKYLIQLWVAEGLVSNQYDMSAEVVAEYYFNELVGRSLILPSAVGWNGKVKSCRIHDLMVDVLVFKSKEENMISIISKQSRTTLRAENVIRRLSLQGESNPIRCIPDDVDLSRVRSLSIYNCQNIPTLLPRLRLLRVMVFEDYTFDSDAEKGNFLQILSKLRHLRYLSLKGTHLKYSKIFSKSICKLQNLVTLDIRDAGIRWLYSPVVELRQLRHLLVACSYNVFRMKPGVLRNLKDLQTLVGLYVNNMEIAEELGNFLYQLGCRFHSLCTLHIRHQIAVEIQEIKNRIGHISDCRLRYGIVATASGSSNITGSTTPDHVDHRLGAFFVQEAQLVGIDLPRKNLINLLKNDEQHLRVITVLGMAGLGKTTLAKRVYEDPQIASSYFYCHAWTNVSQPFNLNVLLKDIIRQVSSPDNKEGLNKKKRFKKFMNYRRFLPSVLQKKDLDKMQSKEDLDKMQSKEDLDKMQSEKDLIEKLKSLLQNKRYIIVLDDIWNIDAWESIKHALPENNNGSRVIVTTRIEEVANNCCAGAGGIDYVYKLELLSKENSMELFENRVFGLGKHCPKHLQKVKNDVVMKCGGLPLAIVAMAGIFASMPNLNDQQQWTNLLNNLPSALETKHSLESMKQVLLLSYNHLPYFIKPCFLYLSIFPEFHLIKRKYLIQLWVAEGLVSNQYDMSAEVVAEYYFNELVGRSLILPSAVGWNGKVKSCRIHDLMVDVLVFKSKEENMISIISKQSRTTLRAENVIRRLSLQGESNPIRCIPDDVDLSRLGCRFHSLCTLHIRHQIAVEIQEIKNRIGHISDCRLRYGIVATASGSSNITGSTTPDHVDHRLGAFFVQEAQLVGIDLPRKNLINLLKNDEQHLRVITVLGMAGLGKTTLAKRVYEDPQIASSYFYCHAWTNVSQPFNLNVLLKDIIRQVSSPDNKEGLNKKKRFKKFMNYRRFLPSVLQKKDLDKMQSKEDLDKMQSKEDLDKMHSEKDLIEKLKSLLQNKRYIIVLDDIWNIDAWESIKHALHENNNGSRVIVTTRIEEVANNCCAGAGGIDYVYKLELLSKENSMELFENRVFGLGKHCPKHLQKVKNDVVMKCGGLPLAIVAMAGIFASMPNLNDQQQWTNLLNNLPSALETKHSLESMKQVLLLSYNHLPYFIKPCFLYLSIFPEFHLIKRKYLIQLWVAEGLVSNQYDMSAEVVAEYYFNELVGRSLILPSTVGWNGKVKSCRIHDLMVDVLVFKSKEENMISIISKQSRTTLRAENVIRRLSLQGESNPIRCIPDDVDLSRVRSLSIYNCQNIPTLLPRLRLLRVMVFEDYTFDSDAEKGNFLQILSKLRHLRYLSLKGTHLKYSKIFSKSICKLQNLVTLDIRDAGIRWLYSPVVELRQLRHLLVACSYNVFRMKPGVLRNLKDLQTLVGLYVNNMEIAEELGAGGFQKLKMLEIKNMRVLKSIEFQKDCMPVLEKLVIISCGKLLRVSGIGSLLCLQEIRLNTLTEIIEVLKPQEVKDKNIPKLTISD
ncbi:hypothetical protein IEQ34_005804 [Dendrobium chrysotoxum]|uniref:NB-ARC domain-containing protein n=1 Tax=Dendrobium chrysotoxum TaxID=161865 RepID=A0AAV7H9X8_DENCH|nr:hypothetical protein IEQ34_005804 [Dendrobium chrysotoxum]